MILQKDREILREVARQQLEAANSEKNLARVELWKRHNDFRGERPIVHVELDTFEQEVIPQRLRCESEEGRALETALYRNFLNLTLFDDDWVVPDYFPVYWHAGFTPFGHAIKRTFASGENAVGHHFEYLVSDLEDDWDKVGKSTWGVDRAGTQADFDRAQEIFGDILPPRMVMNGLYAVPTQDVVHLMGMENMCFAMYDYPELFHKMMDRLTDDYLEYFDFLAKEKLLLPTTGHQLVLSLIHI